MFRVPALLIIAVVGVACGFCFKAAAQGSLANGASLAEEARRLSAKLSKQGFLVPYVVTLDGPKQFELFVAPDDKEHVISLWFATAQATVAIELRDRDGQPLVSWRGTRGEWHFEQKLASGKYGKYVVDVQVMDGPHAHGVIGIKGPATGQCDFDSNRLMEQSPDPKDPPRFSWPAADGPTPARAGTLLVVPNNTGFPSKDGELLRASAICELRFGASAGPLAIADGLGAPLLMPLFPRPK